MAEYDLTTEDGMLQWLQNSTYSEGISATSVERLSGGAAGFVYRVQLQNTSPTSVIVKHAEAYAARAKHWKLDQNRMDFEQEAVKYLSGSEFRGSQTIRTPELLFYDRKDYVLVLEDTGQLPSLKEWLQPGVSVDGVASIGRALGEFLANVHNVTANAKDVKSRFNGNTTAKYLSGTLYFGGLPAAAEQFGYTDDFLKEAARIGQQEVNELSDVLTHGDFWTGNILVDTKAEEDPHLRVLDLELSKPGTAEFDIGQMAAEMYCLEIFRDHKLGNALLRCFLESYKATRKSAIDASKVAIRIGAHLVVIMPRAWSLEASPEQIKQAVKGGIGLIEMGCLKDDRRLRESIVGPLVDK